MKYWMILKQSLKAIFANKGRSFLTVLGIIIGISSVIALISLGNGVQSKITDQISKLGTTNLTVMPGKRVIGRQGGGSGGQGGFAAAENAQLSTSTLTETDLKSLQDKSKNPNIKLATGAISGSALLGPDQNRFTVSGVPIQQFQVSSLTLDKGKLFTQTEIDAKSKVAVIGQQVVKDLYSGSDPLGQEIKVGTDSYTIIGTLAQKDETSFGNPNSAIYVPYTAAMLTFKNDTFGSLTLQAKDENSVDAAKSEAEKTLLANHNISDSNKADFTILSPKDLLSAVLSITSVLTALLAGIAAISLVVGGIGIMNIMLVSVTERTREIGLRKAVGAKTSDILLQFITEAVLLTLAGGILGIGLGILIGRVLSRFVGFNPIVTQDAILLAVGVSSAVGLVFGIYPAAKAARLNPIDALRYE